MMLSSGLSKLGTIIQICQTIEQFDQQDQQCFMTFMQAITKQSQENREKDSSVPVSSTFFNDITVNSSEELIEQCKIKAFEILESSQYKSFAPNNRLSSLPNNIINHLGTYLTKEQSIILGYTDRTLYIASQYKLFIINRRSIKYDKPLNVDTKVVESIIDFNSNKYDSKGWIKFGVGYCFPSSIFIKNVELFSKYGTQDNIKLFASFFEALKFIINVPDTTQCNYWQFLPIELIFDKSIKILSGEGIDLEFRHNESLSMIMRDSLTMLCEMYEKYVQTIDDKDEKIVQIKSLNVCPNTILHWDLWKMLYKRLIVKQCEKLILDIIIEEDRMAPYSEREILTQIDGAIHWSVRAFKEPYRSGPHDIVGYDEKYCINFAQIKQQCNDMNWNPKVFHITIPHKIGTNDDQIRQIYDQLFVDYFAKTETILIRMMAGNDKFDDWLYGYGYEYSNTFLSTLLQRVGITKWKNLNKYIFSIQWNFNLDDEETRKKLYLSKTELRDTILTHPLVPLTTRKEFKYKPLESGVHSKTVNTTSNCSYKSFGNILYNTRKWISDCCQDYNFTNSTLQFCVNITVDC